jgi:hypothetical protein
VMKRGLRIVTRPASARQAEGHSIAKDTPSHQPCARNAETRLGA